MGKFCENCLKKYDDKDEVCLMCGEKLVAEEDCREVCAKEREDVKEIIEAKTSRVTILFISILLFVAVSLTVLILRHYDRLEKLDELRGTYPHSRKVD